MADEIDIANDYAERHLEHSLAQQRNELAALVERVRLVVEEYHSENIACEEAINELVFILNKPESAALSTLKAQWQAEAVENAIRELSYCGYDGQAWVSELEQHALKLRAQEATNAKTSQ